MSSPQVGECSLSKQEMSILQAEIVPKQGMPIPQTGNVPKQGMYILQAGNICQKIYISNLTTY